MIGNEFRRLREEAGLNQKELAELCGVSYGTIQSVESGKGNPQVNSLKLLSDFFKKKIEFFLNEQDEAKLLHVFSRATPRNRGLIIGYAEGLLTAYQAEIRPRTKRPN